MFYSNQNENIYNLKGFFSLAFFAGALFTFLTGTFSFLASFGFLHVSLTVGDFLFLALLLSCSTSISFHSGDEGSYLAGPTGSLTCLLAFLFGTPEAVCLDRTSLIASASLGTLAIFSESQDWKRGSIIPIFLSLKSWLNSETCSLDSKRTSNLLSMVSLSDRVNTGTEDKLSSAGTGLIFSDVEGAGSQ